MVEGGVTNAGFHLDEDGNPAHATEEDRVEPCILVPENHVTPTMTIFKKNNKVEDESTSLSHTKIPKKVFKNMIPRAKFGFKTLIFFLLFWRGNFCVFSFYVFIRNFFFSSISDLKKDKKNSGRKDKAKNVLAKEQWQTEQIYLWLKVTNSEGKKSL